MFGIFLAINLIYRSQEFFKTTTHSCTGRLYFHDSSLLQKFSELESDRTTFGNGEVDELLISAITVLRIHLYELEKVAELCDEFKTKYMRESLNDIGNITLMTVISMCT